MKCEEKIKSKMKKTLALQSSKDKKKKKKIVQRIAARIRFSPKAMVASNLSDKRRPNCFHSRRKVEGHHSILSYHMFP